MSNLIVRIIAQNLAKRGFTQASADVKKFETSVHRATQKLGRMALAAAAVSAVGLAKFASFDKSIREIGTLLGDITEQDIKKMGLEVERMSIRFGQSVEKMAKAKYDIISAGFADATDSAKLLDVSARLAAAGVTEVSKTADVLTSVLNAYGASADQAEYFSDVLFTTVRLGKTTVDQLASGLGRAAAIAPQVGVSFAELSAAVATLTAGGQSTEETMTALTATMTTMLKPPEELTKKLKEMGFASGEAAFKSLGFAGTLEKLTEGMTKAEIAAFFPNVRALRAIFPLSGTLAEKFTKNIKEMGGVAGATQTAFAKMEKGISFKLAQLRQVGERVLRRLGAWVANLVTEFIAMTPAAQNLAIAVGALALAFKFLAFWPTVIIAAGYILYKAWTTNLWGVQQVVQELGEEFRHIYEKIIIGAVGVGAIIRDAISGNWALIGVDLENMNVKREEETKRHWDRVGEIMAEKATAVKGTLGDLIPDFVGMLGLGDIGKIEEKGAETVAAVTEAVIAPIEVARMESAARAAEGEIKAFTGAHKLVFKSAKVTGQQEYQMWNRNFANIAHSGIYQVGQQVSQGVSQWFQKAVGQGQTWFGQLWRAVLQQFLQMMAAMTARWLAFKALTSIFGPGIGGFLGFSRGGIVPQYQVPKVQRAQVGMISQGFDTVPAMLRRGEAVIPTERTRENLPAIRQIMSGQSPSARGGGGGGGASFMINISAIDAKGIYELVQGEEFRNAIVEAINNRQINLNADNITVQGAY